MVPETGQKAPEFSLTGPGGEAVTLSRICSDGPAVLVLFTSVTSAASIGILSGIRDNMKIFRALGATVTGISTEKADRLGEFREHHNLNFTLLADEEREALKPYGVGLQGESPETALFLIDREATVRHASHVTGPGSPDLKPLLVQLMKFSGR